MELPPVLYRDEFVLVLNKPSGLAVHPGYERGSVSLVSLLANSPLRAWAPVHRLDRGTSGVLVCACERSIARTLSEAFAAGLVRKRYNALVRGALRAPTYLVDHAIPADEGGVRVEARSAVYDRARVRIDASPLREKHYSWVEVEPFTGRFHQVRRHLKHLGHPVLGDANYGRTEHNHYLRDHYGLSRLALHAASLACAHPATGDGFSVTAPVPDDLRIPLETLGFSL